MVEVGQTDTKGSHQEMLFLVIQSMQEEDNIIGGKFGLSWKIRIAQKSEDGGVPSISLNCSIFLEVCHTLGWTGLSDEFLFSLNYLNLLCLGVQSESGYETQIFPPKIKKKWYDLQLLKIYTKMEAFLCNNISIFGKILKNPGVASSSLPLGEA